MANLETVVLVFVSVFICFEAQSGFLDFDELSSINYGIDIIDEPVVLGQEPPGTIVLRSKYGQQYQCSYTDPLAEGERERQEQQEAKETGILELLRPLSEGPCLKYPKDWWTYELCYGKNVKQYHMEESTSIIGNIIHLGYFESEFNWNNITEKAKSPKYHSQLYTNGTTCDITNRPRQVEVKFECQEVAVDTIFEISEAQTCAYTLVVHTFRLCKHPALKKAAPAKPVPITCSPLISPAQYEEYIIEQGEEGNEMNEMKPSKLTEDVPATTAEPDPSWEKLIPSHPDGVKAESEHEETSDVETRSQAGQPDAGTAEPRTAATKLIDELVGKARYADTGDGDKLKSKVFSPDELKEVFKPKVTRPIPEGGEPAEDQQGQGHQDGGPEVDADGLLKMVSEPIFSAEEMKSSDDVLSEQQDDIDDDEEIMADFNKEFDQIVDSAEKKAQIEMHQENINSAMQAKFSDIVDEGEQEMAQEGHAVKLNRHQAFSDLAKTLTKLLSRLHRSEREKRAARDHLMKAQLLAEVNKVMLQTSQLPVASSKQGDKGKIAKDEVEAQDETLSETDKIWTDKEKETTQLEKALNQEHVGKSPTVHKVHQQTGEQNQQRTDQTPQSNSKNQQTNQNQQLTDQHIIKDWSHQIKDQHKTEDGSQQIKDQHQIQDDSQQIKDQHQIRDGSQQIKDQHQRRDGSQQIKDQHQIRDGSQQIKDQHQIQDGSRQTKDQHQIQDEDQQIKDGTQSTDASRSEEAPSVQTGSGADDVDPDGSSLTQLHSLNTRVRVRVTRIKQAAPTGGGEGETREGGEEQAENQQTLQLPEEKRRELETAIKSELKRAGLETTGQKIEVKMITAGYFDTKEEGVHILSEEESSAFNNMIVSILGGNSQAAKEMTHHQQMEDSYNHVWGKGTSKKQQ